MLLCATYHVGAQCFKQNFGKINGSMEIRRNLEGKQKDQRQITYMLRMHRKKVEIHARIITNSTSLLVCGDDYKSIIAR